MRPTSLLTGLEPGNKGRKFGPQLSQMASVLALCLVLVLAVAPVRLPAADEAFVGVLALAVDPQVAKQVGIDEELRAKLVKLVDEREAEAVELALQIKDLPAAERAAKLQPFVTESEAKGFALLTDQQKTRLQQLRIERAGLVTLADPDVAKRLGLSDSQRDKIDKVLQQRTAALGQGGEQERRLAYSRFERELAGILSREQRTQWDQLAGLSALAAADEKPEAASDEPADKSTEGDDPKSDEGSAKKPSATAKDKPAAGSNGTSTNGGKVGKADASEPLKDARSPSPDGKLKFSFRFAPWKDVLDWFAGKADLSLVMDSAPPGTFNYTDTREFTPGEAIDLLNSVLLTKGYSLIRRERLLILINLEDPIPEPLIDVVSPKELDSRGKYELVRCIFPLNKFAPEEAEKEISKLIGPMGQVNVMPQARMLNVRETVSKLRAIRDMIEAVENPPGGGSDQLTVVPLEYIPVEEFISTIRPLIGLPENTLLVPDGSLRISPDPANARLLVNGKSDKIERLKELKKLLDVPSAKKEVEGGALEQPQLEIHSTNGIDPDAALQVLQTLMSGQTDVRLARDPKTGNIVALARPSQQATIRATLEQMQRDVGQPEVFILRRVDPQVAVLAINKLFGSDEKDKSGGSNALRVESDTSSRQLYVYGSPAKVAQVRTLLQKMGEGETATGVAAEPAERGNVRMLSLSGRTARTVLEEIEAIWPVVRPNKVRIVRPSNDMPQYKLREDTIRDEDVPALRKAPATRATPDKPEATPAKPATPAKLPAPPRNARLDSATRIQLISQLMRNHPTHPVTSYKQTVETAVGETLAGAAGAEGATDEAPAVAPKTSSGTKTDKPAADKPTGDKPAADTPHPDKPSDTAKPRRLSPTTKPGLVNQEPAEIVIVVSPRDITIASEDLDALDAFEELLRTLSDRLHTPGGETTVFYLRYANADSASALLQEVLGGSASSEPSGGGGGGGGGGGLFGDLAAGMLGDMGGGLLGNLLGGGGGGSLASSGAVSIIADPRLNALFVKANASDLDTIEQLLKVIDQEASPEPDDRNGKPRFLPIYNTTAEEVATVVRQVFASRIAADASQPRQPSPEDLVRALRGGGRQNSRQQAKSEPAKMTLGVDVKSNSLIVSAPEPLFLDVKSLVEQLDHAAEANRDEAIRTVVLKGANPQVLQRALSSLTGGQVRVNAAGTTTGPQPGMVPGGPGNQGAPFGTAIPFGPGGGQPQINLPQVPGGGFPGGGFPGGGFPGGGNRGGGGGNRGGGGRPGGGAF